MAISFGRLISGAGDVAQGMEDMTKLRQSNEDQAIKLRELRKMEALANMPAQDLDMPVSTDLTGGISLDKMDVEQVVAPAPAQPAAPAQPQRGVVQTVPKAAPVTPEQQEAYKKANPQLTVPQKEMGQTYQFDKPAPGSVLQFNRKDFNWMNDGPSLLKPMLTPDGKMKEQSYQATRLELLKQVEGAKQRMTAGGAFAGNQELVFYQNQLNYLDSTYNSLKRKNRVEAALPIAQQQVIPEKQEARVAVDTLGGYQLPKTQATRLTKLQDMMPAQLQADGTKALIKRAQDLGIDPGAAVAVFALENNYGGQKKSGAGAVGSMQVMPGTYADVKRIFSDPNSVATLRIPPAVQQLAASLPSDMAQATPEQLRDAGLLYIYHLQNHKQIPTNMLGAAYHAGPNRKEFAEGLVPNTYDSKANIWTPDHNAMYVALYNQFAQLSGGTAVAQPNAAPTGTQKIANAMESAPVTAPVTAAQPTAPATAAAQPVVAGPVATDTTPGLKTTGTQTQQVAKQPSIYYAANPQAITGDMKIVQNNYKTARDSLAQRFERYRSVGMNEKAMEVRDQVLQLDNAFKSQAYYLEGMRGVYNLEYGNDPRGVAATMSFYAGQPVAFQPRSDGTFNMFVNGNKVAEGYTRDQVRDMARDLFDAEYRKSKAAAQSKFTEMRVKNSLEQQMEVLKGTIDLIKQKAVKTIEGKNALDLELLKKSGYEVKPLGGEGGAIIIPPIISGQPPFFFNSSGRTIEIDGIKITSMSAYPIAGLPTLQTR